MSRTDHQMDIGDIDTKADTETRTERRCSDDVVGGSITTTIYDTSNSRCQIDVLRQHYKYWHKAGSSLGVAQKPPPGCQHPRRTLTSSDLRAIASFMPSTRVASRRPRTLPRRRLLACVAICSTCKINDCAFMEDAQHVRHGESMLVYIARTSTRTPPSRRGDARMPCCALRSGSRCGMRRFERADGRVRRRTRWSQVLSQQAGVCVNKK